MYAGECAGCDSHHSILAPARFVNRQAAFVIVSLGVLAYACAPRSRGGDGPGTARSTKSRSERTNDSPATPRIESALAVNAANASHDVKFDFAVTNSGGGKAEMHFASGQTHDVVVLDTLGREVWRWSKGRMFTRLVQNKVLRNADTLEFGERWSSAPRGHYVAVARLESSNYPIEQRTPFVVK